MLSSRMWKTEGAWEAKYGSPPTLTTAELTGLPESELSKMGIKGLTDKDAELARIGELRKGAARTEADIEAKRPGKDLGPALRFTAPDEDTVERFTAIYGNPTKRVLVYLPGATIWENFDAWQEDWKAGGLVHRCDGETCTVWRDDKGEYQHTEKPCPGGCKEVGRLRVMIPDLERLAYVTVLTGSKHDILNLSGQLKAYQGLSGSLHGIPFTLSRVKRMVSTPRPGGKRVRSEKWLLSLEPATDWVHLQMESARVAALPQLSAPSETIIDAETGEITEAAPEPEDDNGWEDDYEDPGMSDAENIDVDDAPDSPPLPAPPNPHAYRDEFYARVIKQIPYYRDGSHVGMTLKALGYKAINPKHEDRMWADLQTHASEKADEEAE